MTSPTVVGRSHAVSGTWDFKWLPGTTIRLAFQMPRDVAQRELERARGKILALANTWMGFAGTAPDISFFDTGLTFVAPERSQNDGTNRSERTSDDPGEYDVLISLERLPTTRFDPGARIHQWIPFPATDLGTYARRVDYGAPTTYVGPWHSIKSSFSAFYDEPLTRCLVLHEIGHVLGLAHEHQSPKVRRTLNPRYKSAEEIIRIINTRLGTDIGIDARALALVKSQILDVWPGQERFSDWRDFTKGDRIDSVMSHPGHDCILSEHGDCHPLECKHFLADIERLQSPSDSDLAQLRCMYGTRSSVSFDRYGADRVGS